AYNAQAVVCADGAQLILATNLVATSADAPSFSQTILGMQSTVGLPERVLADTGYASGPAIAALQAEGIEPLVAIGRTQPHRPYDFRPPPPPKQPRRITEPWRIAMNAKMETEDAKDLYKKRKQTVDPVFGIIKTAIGFRQFSLRGIGKAAAEWTLVTLAYNCRRMVTLQTASPSRAAVTASSGYDRYRSTHQSDRLLETTSRAADRGNSTPASCSDDDKSIPGGLSTEVAAVHPPCRGRAGALWQRGAGSCRLQTVPYATTPVFSTRKTSP